MSKPILHIKSAAEAESVFYEAFNHCDADVMAALWAEEDVICIHPGSGLISGHEAVVKSWRHVLDRSQTPQIRYTTTQMSSNDGLAVHVVVEEIIDNGMAVAVVLATNVYRRLEHGWLMVEHHGSLVQQQRQGVTLQ